MKIIRQWQSEGTTHILIFEAGLQFIISEHVDLDPLSAEDVDALDFLRGTILIPIWDEYPSYTLYEIQVDSP